MRNKTYTDQFGIDILGVHHTWDGVKILMGVLPICTYNLSFAIDSGLGIP